MRRQILAFSAVYPLRGVCFGAQNDPVAVNCTQFMAWTAGGMSSQRLIRLAHQRGIAFTLDAATSQSLLTAGAEPALLQNLRIDRGQQFGPGKSDAGACPVPLARAGELIRSEEVSGSAIGLAEVDRGRSGDAALDFALGYVHQQQEDWDEALDVLPGFRNS